MDGLIMKPNVVYNTPIEETFGQGIELFREDKHLLAVETKGKKKKAKQPKHPVEKDPETGLEIVKKETIYDKYGIELDPNNSFHASVQRFFDKNGFITPKQLACFD